ncbi:hypothetical protein [Ornithinimicrobium avium]|uniref:Hemerythrin-like domain-containing protein n=1 Tax=Ornithinimicrobium avium TaxID=2283195 RepID=A0A345NL08_9MICO|nr:hypothetical protein [Ornithinimicrobium avium]AXH95716.1 hypothetical protein DV701_05895 [Ornithinimicrobium avium]
MDPAQRTAFEAYLARVQAQRAELREAVAAVDEALARPLGTARWRERVHTALVELEHDLRDHVELTEGEDGLFETVLAEDTRLSPAVEQQRHEHDELGQRVAGSLATLEAVVPPEALPAFREELTTLVGDLVRHRQRVNDLIYEAFSVDLGGQG